MQRIFDILTLNLICYAFCNISIDRSWFGDALTLPDYATCAYYASSATWNGKTRLCSCNVGETFYSLDNGTFGCFDGYGSNIGCNIRSKQRDLIADLSNNNDKRWTLDLLISDKLNYPSLMPMVWDFDGWHNKTNIAVKFDDDNEITISGLNLDFQKELQGKLFKIIFQSSKKSSKVNCFLFKVSGIAELPIYFTKPTLTTVTIGVTYLPSVYIYKEPSNSGGLVIAISVSLCVLLLVFITLIIFYLKQRSSLKNTSNVNKKTSITSNNVENIYADIGSSSGQKALQCFKVERNESLQNPKLVKNLLTDNTQTAKSKTNSFRKAIIHPKRFELSSAPNPPKTPCQILLNENTDIIDDLYLQPVQTNKNKEPNHYIDVIHTNTLAVPKVSRTENCYSMLQTNFEISTYETLHDFGATDNFSNVPTNDLNDVLYSNSAPSNVDIRFGSPVYFETVSCVLNE